MLLPEPQLGIGYTFGFDTLCKQNS